MICFFLLSSCVDDTLYELDGRKICPINHGPCTQDTVLERSIEVIKEFMARDPDEMRFTMIAFSKNPPDEEGDGGEEQEENTKDES